MTERYYIDSAIWRDLHEDRTDKFRPLGEWAFELLKRIRLNNKKVLYSDLTVDELSIAYSRETINKIFEDVSNILQKVEINDKQVKEAASISRKKGIPFGDALHTILARDNNAIMVTRDHHFEEVSDIVTVKKPEELI